MPPWIACKDKVCKYCGSKFNRGSLRSGRPEAIEDFRVRIFCSTECYHLYARGEKHPNYKPGGTVTVWGYVRSVDPAGTGRRGHLHRIKMEKKLGRRLKKREHVHHKDGNKLNNRMRNLVLISASAHASHHSSLRKRDKKGQYA